MNNDTRDKKQENRKRAVKLFALIMFAVAVAVFSALGWFSANKNNTASGASLKVADNGFELGVDSGDEKFRPLYSLLDNTLNNSLITSNEGQTIWWRMETADGTVRPGSEGTLEFYVYPKGEAVGNLKYSLSVRAFTATTSSYLDDNQSRVEVVTGLNEVTSSYTASTSSLAADVKNGKDSLNSHIMFFTGKRDGQYYGFIDNKNSFSLTLEADDTADTPTYKGTIYWVWPKIFGQMKLNSEIDGNKPLLDSTAASYSTDRSKLDSYLTNNVSTIFRGNDNYADLLTQTISNGNSAYNKLSDGYNNADQLIGNNLDYSLITLTVDI